MTTLLDTNVLIALAWPNHIHHARATAWFTRHHRAGWATCPPTESGFVRISSNPAIVDEARTPAEAIELLRKLTDIGGHRFWSDDVSLAGSDLIAPGKILGHRQVTDAHLVAIALRHRGRLATFDRRIAGVVPAGRDPESVLELIAK